MLFVLLALVSCLDDENVVNEKSSLVVEGWIEDGGFPVVILTRSIPVSQHWLDPDSLSNYLVRWATVKISDGTDSVILTGKYDRGYYPPYIYTSSRMMGEAGKTYQLTIDFNDEHVTATTTIPARPQNVSLRVVPCEDSDSLYQILLRFQDWPLEKNYYQLFTRIGTFKKQFLVSYLGSVDDAVLDKSVEIPVYRGHEFMAHDYTPFYHVNDSVTIKFAQIDEPSYHFWDDYTKVLSLSGNMFLSTYENVFSNISGGFGCWCGLGAITRRVVIADSIEKR